MTHLAFRLEVEDVRQSIRVREWHRTQENRVKDAEDRRCDANPERQRQDGEADGSFCSEQPANCKTEIVPES